jgi:4-hydroxyacetophenone monooxygenase
VTALLFNTTPQLIEKNVTEDFIRDLLRDAELPALLPALAQATGDLRLVDPALRPPGGPMGAVPQPQAGMTVQAQEMGRILALEALLKLRDGSTSELDMKDEQNLMALMTFMTGPISTDYLPLLKHELGFVEDMGAPNFVADEVAPDRDFKVVVIGAGMSGLGATFRLKQAGLDVVVLESEDEVGGTWYKNHYPGCRLDTPNFTYSYSFLQKSDWPQAFTEQKYLARYFKGAADELGLRENIRFNATVESMVFSDESKTWTVTYRDKAGQKQVVLANAVVSAVGQLNQPNIPRFEGAETFKGKAWHTAEWRHDIDLAGKRVIVLGTGASAFQVIPTIAGDVAHMTVFQRTPPWMYPAADYHQDIPFGMRWLLARVPTLNRWYRFLQFYMNIEGRTRYMRVDPTWKHPISVSPANEELRQHLEAYIRAEFADRPDLLPHVIPQYPPGAKRMLRDNGVWAGALKRDNVTLVPDGVARIEPSGVRDTKGVLHEADYIIYGTGFRASDFLYPMTVIGRDGVNLHEKWGGDLQAYFGVCTPQFPNLFMLYGPNTNLVVNGSVVFLQEMGIEFILSMIRTMLEKDLSTIEVTPETFEQHNAWLDKGNAMLSWGASGVNSWYKSASGRSTQNWPYSMLDYWQGTHDWSMSDFVVQ